MAVDLLVRGIEPLVDLSLEVAQSVVGLLKPSMHLFLQLGEPVVDLFESSWPSDGTAKLAHV